MGKIFCLMGKSASGKDTVFKKILERKNILLTTVVPGTTRPIREGERDGIEYFYYTHEEFLELEKAGKIIEYRQYNTVHGIWTYFTADDGQIDLTQSNYILIGTLEAYIALRNHFGQENVVPLYIDLDDGERLQRALSRERKENVPKYAEMCRRFLADQEDFSAEKLVAAGEITTFYNEEVEQTVTEIESYMINLLEK